MKVTPPIGRLQKLDSEYDLIIVGGGIYGAALCWEAAHRGIKTLLVEKHDYSSGTSANSLKSIHGGVRSLQSLDIAGVLKGIRELAIYAHIAPNYVHPLPCTMPTTKSLSRSRWFLGSGLLLYNVLQLISRTIPGHQSDFPFAKLITKEKFRQVVPGISDDRITGGAVWFDGQVSNSERMVLQFLQAAKQYNAKALNHVEVSNHAFDRDLHTLVIKDSLVDESEKCVAGKVLIDCTGDTEFLRREIGIIENEPSWKYTRAVNVIVNRQLFEYAAGINLTHPKSHSSRLFFFSPWKGKTLIGTWYYETDHIRKTAIAQKELQSIVAEINSVFSNDPVSIEDISLIHMGYLPVDASPLKSGERIDDRLMKNFRLADWSRGRRLQNLYSLAGTKYTLARHDAQKVIDKLSQQNVLDCKSSKSATTQLIDPVEHLPEDPRIDNSVMRQLAQNYGQALPRVLAYMDEFETASSPIPGSEDHIAAQIYYAVEHEDACTLDDLLKRRLGIGDQGIPPDACINFCAKVMQQLLFWTDVEVNQQIAELRHYYTVMLIE